MQLRKICVKNSFFKMDFYMHPYINLKKPPCEIFIKPKFILFLEHGSSWYGIVTQKRTSFRLSYYFKYELNI